jgi:hypothetical protein
MELFSISGLGWGIFLVQFSHLICSGLNSDAIPCSQLPSKSNIKAVAVTHMKLSETTIKVLRLVEDRSGIPVHVEPDPNLPGSLLAKVVMARGSLALHQVFYRPDSLTPPDYLICQQAGFILRMFSTPPDKRFEFGSAEEGDRVVRELVVAHPMLRSLPAHAKPQLAERFRDGLLNHLRSIPLVMRVDRWIAEELPELHDLQRDSVMRQLQDSCATLAPKHRQSTPKEIYDATQVISAAFAAFWAERLQQPQLSLPFKATGYLDPGLDLLTIWQSTPDVAENDRGIVDQWAEKLGIANWYQWTPYLAPQ